MRPQGSPEELERRRRRAVQLLRDGLPPVEVARMVGVDRRSVRRWNATHRERGLSGLKAKPAPGRPTRLNGEARAKLEEALLAGARAAGFPTDLWTCPRVVAVIHDHFGVRYHPDHPDRCKS
jgi:transposase